MRDGVRSARAKAATEMTKVDTDAVCPVDANYLLFPVRGDCRRREDNRSLGIRVEIVKSDSVTRASGEVSS